MNREELTQSPSDVRPHVVLLGAGASLAAFQNGDESGCQLPLMSNLVDVVGLRPLIRQAGEAFSAEGNFEVTYSRLVSSGIHEQLVRDVEARIRDYFKSLHIGEKPTLYDRLVLSLRSKDAVFTFNWDPFLFDAYARNYDTADLPRIFFLHGNVRIAACVEHPEHFGAIGLSCPTCMKRLVDVPLLYPIETKDYSRNGYIRSSWDAARCYFAEAFVLTIFLGTERPSPMLMLSSYSNLPGSRGATEK